MTEIERTKLGEYFIKKAINKSRIGRRTGLSKQRLSELSIKATAKLMAEELYLVSVAMEVSPCELFEYLYGHLKDQVDTSLT